MDALKHILEDYCYLEYDEEASRRTNGLRVRVTRLDVDRDFSVTGHICSELGHATGRRFSFLCCHAWNSELGESMDIFHYT